MRTYDDGPFGPRICYEANTGTSTKSADDYATEIKTAMDGVKAIAEQALGEAKTNGVVAVKTKEAADEALLKIGGLNAEMASLQQKIVARGDGGGDEVKTFGEQ